MTKGGFYSLWYGANNTVFIKHEYQLHKQPDSMTARWSKRDKAAWHKAREAHIDDGIDITVDGTRYIVSIPVDMHYDVAWAVMKAYNDGKTRKVLFDD